MSINFKIYFEKIEKDKNNVVLLKGNLELYDWNSLKEKIIYNSNHLYFKNYNLEINNNDIFILKIIEVPEINFFDNIKEIYDERTFDYLLKKLKFIKNKINEEELIIKFQLSKVKEVPKSNLSNFDIILKDTLNNTWKNEKERIKKILNEIELTKSHNDILNKFYIKNKSASKENKNIICNKCSSKNFYGPRYICSYCNKFNLCYFCYKNYDHDPKHNFIIIKEPIQNEEGIIKYNNIITPNVQYFNNKQRSFKANFKLINNGEKNLKDCYITFIKFDENNLICKKYEIKDDLEKSSSKEIELEIFFNNSNYDYILDFEGHFRMFNKYGIPFGDILVIKLHNDFLTNY